MLVHYGYSDAQGVFYITIDTEKCASCPGMPCAAACPEGLIIAEEDPYGDLAASIDPARKNSLKYLCSPCKPQGAGTLPPCAAACPFEAISHSW